MAEVKKKKITNEEIAGMIGLFLSRLDDIETNQKELGVKIKEIRELMRPKFTFFNLGKPN